MVTTVLEIFVLLLWYVTNNNTVSVESILATSAVIAIIESLVEVVALPEGFKIISGLVLIGQILVAIRVF